MISLIAAMAHNRVIGNQGFLPWHLPKELAYFKKMTLGKPVLMGRKTYESIGRPLPHRRNLILTQQKIFLPGCEIFTDLETALNAVPPEQELMVIGGALLFEQTLPLAQRLYLTMIDSVIAGDTFFPEWKDDQWIEREKTLHAADDLNAFNFYTIILDRKYPPL